jgi:hypothetical protein
MEKDTQDVADEENDDKEEDAITLELDGDTDEEEGSVNNPEDMTIEADEEEPENVLLGEDGEN